jgi:1,4-alpha-glucan branching enzyme
MGKENNDLPIYLFHQGTNYEAYKFMCPHKEVIDGKEGWTFRVWAPQAKSISVVGDFNGWSVGRNYMNKISVGIWECFIPEAKRYDSYKFAVEQSNGNLVMKSDPFALHTETPPRNASKLYDMQYEWTDSKWIKKRESYNPFKSPMNIYEMNVGSWRTYPDGQKYNYRKLADELIPYLKMMHYTHVEFMPLTEYPFDGSWGYQCTGMFAPTSRFGTPDDLAYLIDRCHGEGIGVIMDWVPAHFPKDEYGLYMFDGGPLYEYPDPQKREHPEWGTVVYDFGRNEVRSFLISSAHFWVEKFHLDGLRVDAVSSMLYLDYARGEGQWTPNINGGNINLEAVSFLQELNKSVMTRFHGVQMIAEESTSYYGVTLPPDCGGLGFTFKWNMGWMNDTLRYIKTDPVYRQYMHNNLTFSMVYAFKENYILSLSHDEVVHVKGSLLGKQQGSYQDKFGGLMTYLSYMMCHPGKKLLFMGGEFGQFAEWNYQKQLDWFLLDYPSHQGLQRYVAELNNLYVSDPAMYEKESDYSGFSWLSVNENTLNILAFMRIAEDRKDYIFTALNFSPVARENYYLGVPEKRKYKVVLDSSDVIYGGFREKTTTFEYEAQDGEVNGYPYHIVFNLYGNNAIFFKPVYEEEKKAEEVKPVKTKKSVKKK